ncbi:MAG: SpoIIE family protein phosphatase [Pirellulales bacterium]|nr:SpoIIE family protein phosphatase [Pirellulales bacterium]
MNRPKPSYLRLHTEEPPQVEVSEVAALEILPDLSRAFEAATGWALHYAPGPAPVQDPELKWSAPVETGVGASLGHFRLDPGRAHWARERKVRHDLPSIEPLASAVTQLTGEILKGEHLLWQREAELAAGVPVTPHREEEKHLAERLEAILSGGARAVGCQAAALYLLDADTTSLKLRSVWGLPRRKLAAPPRQLDGALADLEALLGHAIVLEDSHTQLPWNAPEDFPAAVCVPVSTPTVPLGTLWVFSSVPRGFNDEETNIVEIVAGRLAAELEREMLLAAGVADMRRRRDMAAIERWQQQQLPRVAPLVEGWDLAAWSQANDYASGTFYDWLPLDPGRFAAVVAQADGATADAALVAANVRAMFRTHAEYPLDARSLLTRANRTLWLASPGDQRADAVELVLDEQTGRIEWALAGHPLVLQIARDGSWRSLVTPALPLGAEDEAVFPRQTGLLEPGDTLVIATAATRSLCSANGCPLGDAGMAELVASFSADSALQWAEAIRLQLVEWEGDARQDRTLLVVRRQRR